MSSTTAAHPKRIGADITRYPLAQRVLHWLTAALLAALWSVGFVMTRLITPDTGLQVTVYYLHISLGVVAAIVVVGRLFVRAQHGAPALPTSIPERDRRIAAIGHAALYGLIAAVAASGWFMTESYGYPIIVFGVAVPTLFPKRELIFGLPVQPLLSQVHMVLAYLLALLVFGHVLAVWRHLRHGTNLIHRMWVRS